MYANQDVITLTGFDILQVKQEEVSDTPTQIPSTPVVNNENLISLSALSASIGVATSGLRSPQSAIVTAIAGGLGSGSLWYFKTYNEQITLRGEEGVERVDFGSGFLTCFVSYIMAFVINLLRLLQPPK
ncbi:hypothetical protein C7B64_01890 [Merismopedia glauca CCAP 1448/3]|uniref:Uncharacterized protein n=2 Tax=Merismopedia TaxID=53402 RepID=A0A2T1C9B4_9CYAN|nr:hypothetical protein C7B64_01890 [Merismopedia glauca CCAP 1448/3]